ncbi:hypothetical protein ACH4SP_22610 [Streptomyces sp. NPDC021093]|uniref:hypothetical protein n=1 Tax=Streptomyces sp. NPDC021093 TaxID=3365112 RepID=UPI00379A973A
MRSLQIWAAGVPSERLEFGQARGHLGDRFRIGEGDAQCPEGPAEKAAERTGESAIV